MMKKRIEYIDAIKGMAIILMVLGHVIASTYYDWHDICLYEPEQPINVKVGGDLATYIFIPHAFILYGLRVSLI